MHGAGLMIHVFFCDSAAGTFRQLLEARGITEKVTAISEELDFGPISHGDLADREPWLNQHVPMDFGDHDWLAASEERFRKHVASDLDRLIWIAPASATEHAGLYWYLSQFGGDKTRLAIADYPFSGTWNGKSPLKLGELGLEPMGNSMMIAPVCRGIPHASSRKMLLYAWSTRGGFGVRRTTTSITSCLHTVRVDGRSGIALLPMPWATYGTPGNQQAVIYFSGGFVG
jgi:hypothetical protein